MKTSVLTIYVAAMLISAGQLMASETVGVVDEEAFFGLLCSNVAELSVQGHGGNAVALCVGTKDGKTTADFIQPEPIAALNSAEPFAEST